MKALVVSVVFALTAVVNAVSSNNLNGFAYNSEMNNEHVESQTVFKVENEKYLHYHLKYNYTYDTEGRITTKEVLKWNGNTQTFEKSHCLNMTYTNGEVTMEYASWNNQNGTYNNVKSKAVYQVNGEEVNYQSYNWNEKENSWELTVECNSDSKLLAERN